MASKYELITELADVTAKRITSSREEWTKYLKTAARLYRCPYGRWRHQVEIRRVGAWQRA